MNFKVTEIGELPLEWDVDTMENALDEIIDYRGKTPAKSEAGIETLSAKSVKNGYIDYSKAYFISEMTYQKFMVRGFPRKGDILLTTEAPLGLVAKLDREKVGIAQRLLTLRGKKDYLLNDYLLYYLMSNEGQHQLTSRQSGTTVTGIKQKEFRKCLISIPPFEEQKAIAHILSTLDDKIEVNNEINKTLENMAQAIFKQWFVDFEFPNEDGEPYKSSGGEMVESDLGLIPKGWVVGKLDDIATIVMGQSPKGTSYNEVGEGEVFYQGRTDFSSRFPIRRLFTTEPKRMANDGDVLMSVRAPVGDLNVANERCCIGRGLSAISSSADLSSYILYVMHDLRERLNVYNGEGTVFGSINQKDLKSIKVISSCDNKTEIAFDDLIQPIDRMIRNNEDETRRLINLRDRLLPKLLSGEIRVPLDEEGDAS